MEPLKTKARDELIRITEADLGTRFSELGSKQQSIAAAKFFVREIRNQLGAVISDDDLNEAIVDGKDDLGCDLIHRDDGRVLILQAKYRKPGKQEDSSDISHFQTILKRFRNPDLKPNSQLRDILAEINWQSDSFELIYMTFGQMTPQVRKISSQIPDYPAAVSDLDQRCEWRFLAEDELNIELRSARSLSRGISDKTIDLYPVGEKGARGYSAVVQVNSGRYKSYIMALDARQIIRCYEELGRDSVFSLNIRNFIGNTGTNKNIVSSATIEPENFFLYNNGISCLSSKVEVSERGLRVSGLQVINGAQTVKALVNLEGHAKRIDKRAWERGEIPNILVRVTEVPENYGSSGDMRERITQFNNTQNTIKISDFRSNDPVQSSLKRQFSEFMRNGKRVVYIAKRTDKLPTNSEIVRLEEFAKSVYAFAFDPTDFSSASSFLFSMDANAGYVRVFGDGVSVWEDMPQHEFRFRAGIYWLAQEFAQRMKAVREQQTDADDRAALERKWLLVYAAGCVFRHRYGKEKWRDAVSKLFKGDWVIGREKTGEIILRIFDAAKVGVITSYKNAKRYDPNFGHRNWMRSKSTPSVIEDTLKSVVLPMLMDLGELA